MERVFTREQEAEIAQMYAIGIPINEIIAVHGHRNAVYGVLHRRGVRIGRGGPGRSVTPDEERDIVNLYLAGMNIGQIARVKGRSRDFVSTTLKRQRDGAGDG